MKNKNLILLFFLVLITISNLLLAQDNKLLRVEIEAKSGSDSYKIIPFGKKGVVLFYESNEINNSNNKKWFFTLYDINFKQVWSKEFLVSLRRMNFTEFDYDKDFIYLFFKKSYKNSQKTDFQILKLEVDNGSIKEINGQVKSKVVLTKFKVIGNTAFIGGRTQPKQIQSCLQICFSITLIPLITGLNIIKYHPALYAINLLSGNIKEINKRYKGQAYIENLQADKKRNIINVSIKNYIPRNHNIMHINEYDPEGNELNSIILKVMDNKRKLNTGKIVSVSENEKLIIGTYNNKTKALKANPAFVGFNENSTGIYFAKIINNQQKFINFYNFSEFKTFYNYINQKRAFKIKKKAKRKELKGKELSFDYQLLVHDIIHKNGQNIMIAEAYYPEYHTVYYTNYDYYGRPMTSSYNIFDGYRYTNAIIACFDENGKLLWDNSFKIWNILTFYLKERVKVLFDNDDIILTYSSEGKIISKIIKGNEVIQGKKSIKIETLNKNDEVKRNFSSDIDFWYDNYFITYGYQKIKDKSKGNRRTVFYFNKIAFQ
jgi:hypothetical protein